MLISSFVRNQKMNVMFCAAKFLEKYHDKYFITELMPFSKLNIFTTVPKNIQQKSIREDHIHRHGI